MEGTLRRVSDLLAFPLCANSRCRASKIAATLLFHSTALGTEEAGGETPETSFSIQFCFGLD